MASNEETRTSSVSTGDWPIESVWPNPNNPRAAIRNAPTFEGLVESIKSQGIIQPLLINSGGMILAGHRRYEAAMVIGLSRVPVRVLDDQSTHDLIPLIENLQRADLAVLDVASYLQRCSEEYGMTLVAIASATGISLATINKYLKLANAPIELRQRIERDEIPLTAAFELLRHDEEFIREVIQTPKLTKDIVREKAVALGASTARANYGIPTERAAHLRYAIKQIEGLLKAAPNNDFACRYQRWLRVMGDDLADLTPQPKVERSAGRMTLEGLEKKYPRQSYSDLQT